MEKQLQAVNSITTNYYYSGSQLIAEETEGDITVYLYDASGSVIGMQYHASGSSSTAWDTYWFEKNLQGDVTAVYDENGNKLISYVYDAWGNTTAAYHNNGDNTSAVNNRFTYRGYYYDYDLGLYYLQSRYYDSNTGRFINIDDTLYHCMLGYNMYTYCNNNPVVYIDPTGKNPAAAVLGKWMASAWLLHFVDGPLPIGDIVFWGGVAVLSIVVIAIGVSVAKSEEPSDTITEAPPKSIDEPDDAKKIGETDKLPQQGKVTSDPQSPPVEAGKQGKHVPGHKNYNPDKSSWNNGENGVKQTQQAWKNSKPDPHKPDTRIGVANDGRTIEIKVSKNGIHGYPIFP